MIHATAAYAVNLAAATALMLFGRPVAHWTGFALILLSIVGPNVVTGVQLWRARKGGVGMVETDE